jgi:nucleotide-binding universal stress UspA family protein
VTTIPERTIVVGIDGSTGSDHAVLAATDLAAQRHLGLHIVHGLQDTAPHYGIGIAGTGTGVDALRADGARILRAAVTLARGAGESVPTTTDMPTGPPAPLLTELSRTAGMVVVGHTGDGGFTDMLLGSTAAAVVSHAHCPVLVVRGRFGPAGPPEGGPVVVGVDGSPVSEQAVAAAFEEASARGAPLVAVHAWSDGNTDSRHRTNRYLADWDSIKDVEALVLAERLAGWQEKYPDVEVRRELVLDRPRHALLEWSATARLVVVGSRGRGGFRGMLLGSTSLALVQHARCPVLVVRSRPGE